MLLIFLDQAERKIFLIAESHLKKSFSGMDRAVRDALEYIEAIHSKSNIKFSVPTGFYELDEMLRRVSEIRFYNNCS
jgi:replicative DNA helicase